MSFPVDPLTGKIEFAFGADLHADPSTWVYFDCTTDWLTDRDLAATIGRADATSKPQPAKLSFWLKNPGGKYTKGNPLSQFWPSIRKNTPVRVTLNPGTGHTRVYQMYVTQWIPRWGNGDSGRQPLVQVVANGIRRRLTQGDSPLRAPLFRAITSSSPVAYWPLEDGSDATQAASGLLGGPPMTLAQGSKAKFGATPGPAGSTNLIDLSDGATLTGVVPAGASSTSWRVEFVTKFVKFNPGTFSAVAQWSTGGGVSLWEIDAALQSDGGLSVQYLTASGGGAFYSNVKVDDEAWHHIRVDASQSGSNIALTLALDGATVITQTLTALAMGRVMVATLNPTQDITEGVPSAGHLAVWAPWGGANVDTAAAARGYAGETVHDRLVRLGAEQGVAMSVSTGATTRMGPQLPGPFVGLLDECQEVDGGILLDGLSPGLTYLARRDAYNLPVALTVDMAGRQFKAPFEPLDDDASTVNDETVNRTGGSSAHYVDKTGPAGTDAIERYDDSQTLNVDVDSVLRDHAAWRVHLGTAGADTYRFPGVGFDLHTADGRALIEPWLLAGIRKRVQVVNPPAEFGAQDVIDLLVEGYTETVNSRRTWEVQANASPYVHNVAVVGQTRVDSAGTTVRTTVPAGSSSVQVNVTGPLWTTNATYMPLYLDMDGIRVRVTGISGTSSPQTLTVDPATVTKQLTAGRRVHLWRPDVVAL